MYKVTPVKRAVLDNPTLSHAAIGRLAGVTRERIRQVRKQMGLVQVEAYTRKCERCEIERSAADYVSIAGKVCLPCQSVSRQKRQTKTTERVSSKQREHRRTDPEYREQLRANWRRYYHNRMKDPVQRAAWNKQHLEGYHRRVAERKAAKGESNE